MDVISLCPFRVASVTWLQPHGRRALTVVCRGTFRLTQGALTPAEIQLRPLREARHLRPSAPSSLLEPMDLVPGKRGVDVVLVGHARSPGQIPTTSFVARLACGAIDKSIEVHAERFLSATGELSYGAPVAEVPIAWENASGGPGTDNPVGLPRARRDAQGRLLLPTLQPVGWPIAAAEAPTPPVGFGPIADSWPSRQGKLGTTSAGASFERWWTRPLPQDVDLSFFNVAPGDQRLGRLEGGEPLVLENLLASTPLLRARLPRLAPLGTLTRKGAKPEPLELDADTVWIDTDRELCTIVWRARVLLTGPSEQGLVEIDWAERVPERAQAPTDAPHRGADAEGQLEPCADVTLDDPDGGPTEPNGRHGPTWPALFRGALVPRLSRRDREDATAELPPGPRPRQPSPLPFRPPDGAAASRPSQPPAAGPDPLPFRRANASAAPTTRDEPRPAAPSSPTPPPMVRAYWPPPTPQARPPSPWAGAAGTATRPVRSAGRTPPDSQPPAMTREEVEGAAPPPMLGPLATPEMVSAAGARGSSPPPEAEPDGAPTNLDDGKLVEDEGARDADEESYDPAGLRLLRVAICARVAAILALRGKDEPRILDEHRLDRATWMANDAYWTERIRAETARGRKKLKREYDDGYVAGLEQERGPITADEYAKLAVASSKDEDAEALREMGLPETAMASIESVFSRRMLESASLGDRVRKAIEREWAS